MSLERAVELAKCKVPGLIGLMRMVGFRNVAVHAYQAIDLEIVSRIIAKQLGDLIAFARWAVTTQAG